MSEPQLQQQPNQGPSNAQTIIFMVILSFVCALILSVLASALAIPKEVAKDLDRSKQMMIAAKILDHQGFFLIKNGSGDYVPAKLANGILVPGTTSDIATQKQLLEMYKSRIVPFLVDNKGEFSSFQQAKINEEEYMSSYKKTGYYKQPQKLVYKVLPNGVSTKDRDKVKPELYVIPVNGFGLWDAIYGYLAIQPDGNSVVGISWYDQKETPGLGANISEPSWQSLFPGKEIFQPSVSSPADFKTAPLGITVVKGKVSDVLGSSPKAKTAVDGMAGATLTGNGVTDAYKNVLAAYRPFLIHIHDEYEQRK